MDNLIVPLVILFFIASSIFDAIRKARLKQRMDGERQLGGEGEWQPASDEPDEDQVPSPFQPPSSAPRSRPTAPPREESPEEAIRRLFMGEAAAPPAPPPQRAPQPIRPPAPRPQPTPERTPQSGLDRISETRDMRAEQERKSEEQKRARMQATRDAKAKVQRQEERFRQEALSKERAQSQRMAQVRKTYRRSRKPDVSLARAEPVCHEVSRVSRANLRSALIMHEILQPPLALRRRRADRRER